MIFLLKKQILKFLLNLLAWLFLVSITNLVSADEDTFSAQEPEYFPGEIFLGPKQFKNAGISLQTLSKIKFKPELISFGEIINIIPLITAKNAYQLASVKLKIAVNDFAFHQKNLNRVQKLFRKKVISNQKLQNQLEKWRLSKMQLNTTRLDFEQAKEIILFDWGSTLLDWITTSEHKKLESILAGNEKIILVSLPTNNTLPTETSKIFIHQTGLRNQAIVAELIGPSPKVRGLAQGESYFFLANNPKLRTGMQITAWIPQQTNLSGVLIPNSSLVRHFGQAFVYLETSPQTFSRYQIKDPEISGDHYFVPDANLDGKKIVKTGAQILLAEEFRAQIPEENDD